MRSSPPPPPRPRRRQPTRPRCPADCSRPGSRRSPRISKLDVARHFPWLDSRDQQALDVERFRRVAGDLLAVGEEAPNRVVDLRYSLVPNEISGFWAIVLDPSAAPDAQVGFVATRENARRDALRLLDILFE